MIGFEGSTLLDRVLDATAGAEHVVVVGPVRPTAHAVMWCEERPVGGGPVAAFAAGLSAVPPSENVLLLASDLPFIAGALRPLLDALMADHDAAVLVDGDGRANYLASAWRRSVAEDRVEVLGDPTGLPMRRLFEGIDVAEVRDTDGWGFDCDTWESLESARQRGATSTS